MAEVGQGCGQLGSKGLQIEEKATLLVFFLLVFHRKLLEACEQQPDVRVSWLIRPPAGVHGGQIPKCL